MSELPAPTLLPGFTDRAFSDLQSGSDIVLIHRWASGLSDACDDGHDLVGQHVKSCVRVVESRGGGILVEVPWLQKFVVARADIHDWHVAASNVPAGAPIPSTLLRAVHHDYRYPPSPWMRASS
jgi:hypothetical protein